MSFTLWFTGLSGSGKSTLSSLVYLELKRRIGFVSHLLTKNRVISVVAAIAPYAEARRNTGG